ncbi:tyrosine-type recombinase/integrase [Microbacterium allomyrinae]|uniref:Tyrosine-type recombinase/integrase family protein n=1 Tax=Microbacterium allomyrinae TaxID=2830666 RepID=A0A9X1LU44_9MICO|nr:site-specific integrase [Microbacterium allomyrinae]MCC2031847.1 tyrosine-type recombinase/integrase family protein [Microbacterium allomyrinae]
MAHITENQTTKGTRYTVRWRSAPDKFRKRSFYVKREAERFRDKVEREQADGHSTEPFAVRGKKFREVAERMLEAERPRLKQKTIDAYEAAFRSHVYPEFGSRQINTITSADLDAFNAMMRAKPKANGQPRSETSVLGANKAVARVLTYAYKHRLIAFNPCVAVARPKADTQEARFLSVEEVMRISDEFAAQPPYDLLVRLAAFSGLRIGEVAALRIRDIDLRAGEIQVRLNKTHTSQGYQTGTPKRRAGKRDVPILDETLLSDLSAHLRAHPYRADLVASLWPGEAVTNKVYAHLRKRDYSAHRAAFSAHIAAATTPPSSAPSDRRLVVVGQHGQLDLEFTPIEGVLETLVVLDRTVHHRDQRLRLIGAPRFGHA